MADPRVEGFVAELKSSREFFERSTRCLREEDSSFKPADDMLTAAQQFAHVGQTVDWFLDGAFNPNGFDLDFEAHAQQFLAYTSIEAGRKWVAEAFDRPIEKISATSFDDLAVPMPQGMVMGGAPRFAIVGGVVEHTAHHRGALSVYSRLRGLVPTMPYMEA